MACHSPAQCGNSKRDETLARNGPVGFGLCLAKIPSAYVSYISHNVEHLLFCTRLASVFPLHFKAAPKTTYVAGTLASMISKDIVPRLSTRDRDAINKFLPEFLASESAAKVNLLTAEAQIESLSELADSMEKAMSENKSEHFWQTFIEANILLIQQGYIKAIDKMNTAIGGTKFPDFLLVTHDNYLDILEIKKPQTELLKHDTGRDNYFFDNEVFCVQALGERRKGSDRGRLDKLDASGPHFSTPK
jgi:hypothetical protein